MCVTLAQIVPPVVEYPPKSESLKVPIIKFLLNWFVMLSLENLQKPQLTLI